MRADEIRRPELPGTDQHSGEDVDEGDTVVILESMKMEMPVEAEDAGTVKEILCEEGQAVNEGDTLVVLE